VNSSGRIAWRDAAPADEATLLLMMAALAMQEPAIAFDENEVRDVLRIFLAHPEYGKAWVLDDEGRVAGYLILTLGFSFEYRGRDAFIDELYIEPAYRGRGFGRIGMQVAEECARQLGVNAVHLEVDRANHSALEFYRRIRYQDHDRYLLTKWLRK
jgi:GNAT superfamily N-acetyltransferase